MHVSQYESTHNQYKRFCQNMGLSWEIFDPVTSFTPFLSSKTLKNIHRSMTFQRSGLRKLNRINLDIKYPIGPTTEICLNGCAAFSSYFALIVDRLSFSYSHFVCFLIQRVIVCKNTFRRKQNQNIEKERHGSSLCVTWIIAALSSLI